MLNESAVAHYKVALLIPANITFLAVTFMQSDFPVLAKNYRSKRYLKSYIVNYYKLFLPIVLMIFAIGFLFRVEILTLFFKEGYAVNSLAFVTLLAAFCMNMLLRNLYGNLLSAVGLMKINTVISFVTLILLPLFSYLWVDRYGIAGMAISMALTMSLSGLMLAFCFYRYWKDLN